MCKVVQCVLARVFHTFPICGAKVRTFPYRTFTLVNKKVIKSFFPVSYLSKKFQICAKHALQHIPAGIYSWTHKIKTATKYLSKNNYGICLQDKKCLFFCLQQSLRFICFVFITKITNKMCFYQFFIQLFSSNSR